MYSFTTAPLFKLKASFSCNDTCSFHAVAFTGMIFSDLRHKSLEKATVVAL